MHRTRVTILAGFLGAGKTTLLSRTVDEFGREHRCAVVVGDLETDNDARRLHRPHVPVAQITTGSACHLDADMVARARALIPELRERAPQTSESIADMVHLALRKDKNERPAMKDIAELLQQLDSGGAVSASLRLAPTTSRAASASNAAAVG